MPFKCQKDTHMQWFQTRINNRILGTNVLLNKMKIKNDNLCSLCHKQKRNNPPLVLWLWVGKKIWNELQTLINTYCPSISLNLVCQDIIFGNRYFANVLNTIIMLAKYHIFKTKETVKPSIEFFKKQLINQYRIDQYISRKNLKQDINDKYWSPLINLITNIN